MRIENIKFMYDVIYLIYLVYKKKNIPPEKNKLPVLDEIEKDNYIIIYNDI